MSSSTETLAPYANANETIAWHIDPTNARKADSLECELYMHWSYGGAVRKPVFVWAYKAGVRVAIVEMYKVKKSWHIHVWAV